MPTFTGKTGNSYTIIEPALGKGGEGSVYSVSGKPNYVVKVFLEKNRTETRHRKLLAMLSTPLTASALDQITWPVDVVYQNGQFVGYVMPAIKNNEDLNVLYSSNKYSCTLSEKIIIAKNLCAAINSVHEAGQVCGDLNPKNIGVDPQSAKITLVDTDSYHITEKNGSRVYRCEVGLPEYLPREIQEKMKNGNTLSTAPLPTFSKYTDLFALAVHVFALLMNGCHPFACAINNKENIGNLSASRPSVTAPQPIDNICTGFFPFYTKKSGITTPIYAPPFEMLPKSLRALFIRAFVDGHNDPTRRPDCVEWFNALTEMQNHLSKCRKNKQHLYPDNAKKCPWCAIDDNMAKMHATLTMPVSSLEKQQSSSNNTRKNITSSTSITKNKTTNSTVKKKKNGSAFNKLAPAIGLIPTVGTIGAIIAETYFQASNSDLRAYWVIFIIDAIISVFVSLFFIGMFGEDTVRGTPLKISTAALYVIPSGIIGSLAFASFFAGWWQEMINEWKTDWFGALMASWLVVIVFGLLSVVVLAVAVGITQALPALLQSKTNEMVGGLIGIAITAIAAWVFFSFIETDGLSLVIPYLFE